MTRLFFFTCLCLLSLTTAFAQQVPVTSGAGASPTTPAWLSRVPSLIGGELVAKYGEAQRVRAHRGVQQIAQFWRAEDGDSAAFEAFALENFAGTAPAVDTMFTRFQNLLEQYGGHMQEIGREFRNQTDLDAGPIKPYDAAFAGYDPSAHFSDDMFENKLAFTVLLNFPLTTLTQRLNDGPSWSRRQWAEARLAQQFSRRVPAKVNLVLAGAGADADAYVAGYNIWMHHLVDDRGQRLFPPGMRLLAHWNLRDEIKSDYADAQSGLAKQRSIQQVMERIVTQTIPGAVIDNPTVDWNPFTNAVKPATAKDSDRPLATAPVTDAREPDTRYAKLLGVFNAVRLVDPYSPTAPTLIARRFDENREIPEERVKAMLVQVLTSPLVARTASLIRTRLGRSLEPFDIWYNGFRTKSRYDGAELDRIVSQRYPTAEAYKKDIPRLLEQLGFPRNRAEYIAANIVVDPARGSGHAMGASMRGAKVHLRTRVEKGGMNYKGYNIAVHEMGHNVEQTLSLNDVDNTLLAGVPNTAFTEALAFVFQAHDLDLLGLAQSDVNADALHTLNDFWTTYEIAGVALVDMGVWHWMYDHPNATPAQLRDATLQIARDVWNKYYASVFGKRDVVLLAVYQHMIDSILYLPDYPIGHLIAYQIEEKMRSAGTVGPEFERMAKFGSLTPDMWMQNASGSPVGAEAMLQAVERSLKQLGG